MGADQKLTYDSTDCVAVPTYDWANRRGVVCLVLMALWFATSGCNRAYYRRQADDEVYSLVDCVSSDPRWDLGDYTIEPSNCSRFYDPAQPDCPPMPPDDPASHRYMECVDGKRGWPYWSCNGCESSVQNPIWMYCLPLNKDGSVVLDRQGAVQLALTDSREYQKELENLYLSALDVTYQRFRFDAQFYGGDSLFFTTDGRVRGGGQSLSNLQSDNWLRMQKYFATGGELLVGVANSLVWQFAGPDDYNGTTLLDFSLVQPLLRAGGREVALEDLTQSERNLLANVRQMERFRRSFYTQIVGGRAAVAGPSRNGVGIVAVSRGGSGATGGLFNLLEEQVRIRNLQANMTGLRDSLDQIVAFNEAGRIDRLQVDQARQALLVRQSGLLVAKTNYQDALDSYKIELGLPPELDVRIEDPMLERLSLIDPGMTRVQSRVSRLLGYLRDPDNNDFIDDEKESLNCADQLKTILVESAKQLGGVQHDYDLLIEALPKRRRNLEELATRPEVRSGEIDPSACDVKALERRVARLKEDLLTGTENSKSLTEALLSTLAKLDQCGREAIEKNIDIQTGTTRVQAIDLLAQLSAELLELSLMQARARLDAAILTPVHIGSKEALEIARYNRLDWMNARASLVDAWREIEVIANELESDLDLTFSGDLGTVDGHPFRFRGTNGRLRVGLEFDAPLTRLVERNDYRETLIIYQQRRRDFYAFGDRVSQSLRATLRAIRQNELQFEISREAARVAIAQVDQTQLKLLEPPRKGKGTSLGATTTRDLVQALSGLLTAQNGFVSIWVNNEAQRMYLQLDMGKMRLDAQGMWIDPDELTSEPIEQIPTPDPETT